MYPGEGIVVYWKLKYNFLMEDVIKTRKSVTLKRGTDIQSKKAFLTM